MIFKNLVAYFRKWQDKIEEKNRQDYMIWMENHPLYKWKVYSTNPYNYPPAKSVTVMARTYSGAIEAAGRTMDSEWKIDPIHWHQDWAGAFFAVIVNE